jgi:expansin (peptidoglycan-binding protein)
MRVGLALLFLAGCGGSSGGVDADAAGCEPETPRQGEATYYDADGSGNCSFDPSPQDLMVAAANPTDYAGSDACGACAAVDGPDGSVTVRIVDQCPGCAAGDLDLSPQAFERIAPLADGRVPITWRFVPCAVDGPMRYRFKEGSNPFWTALQVRNHRHRIALLRARPAGGEWRTIERASYNYFVDAAGLGDGPIDLLVMDVHGHMVTDTGIAPGDAVERTGSAQLAECPGP